MKHVSAWENVGERIRFKGCEMFPKEINFQLQLGNSLALTMVGRSLQYFSEPRGSRVKAGMSDYQVTLLGEPSRQN